MTDSTWTVIVEPEGDGFVAHCPELDIASQGATSEEAHDNVREAIERFIESASFEEIENKQRQYHERTR